MKREENILIAEFMHLELAPEYIQDRHNVPLAFKGGKYQPLQYDTDWNALMPVVEKIESLKFRTDIGGTYCEIHTPKIIFNEFNDTKIKATYNSVIAFINWYNQQPTN